MISFMRHLNEYIFYVTIMNKSAKNIKKILSSQGAAKSDTNEQEQSAKNYAGFGGFWRSLIGGVPIHFLSRVIEGKNSLNKK